MEKRVAIVAAGAKDVVLDVQKGVTMAGFLQDAEGRPLKTHYLAGHAPGTVGGVSAYTRVGDDEGKFVLAGLQAGKVALSAYVGDRFVELGVYDAPAGGVVVKVPAK